MSYQLMHVETPGKRNCPAFSKTLSTNNGLVDLAPLSDLRMINLAFRKGPVLVHVPSGRLGLYVMDSILHNPFMMDYFNHPSYRQPYRGMFHITALA